MVTGTGTGRKLEVGKLEERKVRDKETVEEDNDYLDFENEKSCWLFKSLSKLVTIRSLINKET